MKSKNQTTVTQYIERLRLQADALENNIKLGTIKEDDLIYSASAVCWKDEGWMPSVTVDSWDDGKFRLKNK